MIEIQFAKNISIHCYIKLLGIRISINNHKKRLPNNIKEHFKYNIFFCFSLIFISVGGSIF